jgi:hypothetical protein
MDNAKNLYKYCKQCYISIERPKKKLQKHIVLSNYKELCVNCEKMDRLVIDIDMEEEE